MTSLTITLTWKTWGFRIETDSIGTYIKIGPILIEW